jgi:hypothetical protein
MTNIPSAKLTKEIYEALMETYAHYSGNDGEPEELDGMIDEMTWRVNKILARRAGGASGKT